MTVNMMELEWVAANLKSLYKDKFSDKGARKYVISHINMLVYKVVMAG